MYAHISIWITPFICHYVLKAIFPGERGLASFTEAKDDGSGGDKNVQSLSQIITTNKATPSVVVLSNLIPEPSAEHQLNM